MRQASRTGLSAVRISVPVTHHELDGWAGRLKTWAEGGEPDDLPLCAPDSHAKKTPRDVFAFLIHEGKVRAPHGAMALIEKLR